MYVWFTGEIIPLAFYVQNNYPALDMFPARDIFASLHFEGNFRPAEGDMRWYYGACTCCLHPREYTLQCS